MSHFDPFDYSDGRPNPFANLTRQDLEEMNAFLRGEPLKQERKPENPSKIRALRKENEALRQQLVAEVEARETYRRSYDNAVKRNAQLRAALRPFACLELQKKPQGNAGFWSLFHEDIRRAKTTLAQAAEGASYE